VAALQTVGLQATKHCTKSTGLVLLPDNVAAPSKTKLGTAPNAEPVQWQYFYDGLSDDLRDSLDQVLQRPIPVGEVKAARPPAAGAGAAAPIPRRRPTTAQAAPQRRAGPKAAAAAATRRRAPTAQELRQYRDAISTLLRLAMAGYPAQGTAERAAVMRLLHQTLPPEMGLEDE